MDAFLDACGWLEAARAPLAGDASRRRYLRLTRKAGGDGRTSALLMDSPHDDVRPFLKVAALLRQAGFSAPEVMAADAEEGLLLVEDFGDRAFSRLMDAHEKKADKDSWEERLTALAVDTLIALHRCPSRFHESLPPYDQNAFAAEHGLLVDWHIPAFSGRKTGEEARRAYFALWRELLEEVFAAVPRVWVLRDYHGDNLIWLEERCRTRACGLLDFQDAVAGPAPYDLASLLDDVRRPVSPLLKERMKARYVAAFPHLDPQSFARAFAVLSAQRLCKIAGIFVRLERRDGKSLYRAFLPRCWALLEDYLRHPALASFSVWCARHLPPHWRCPPPPVG